MKNVILKILGIGGVGMTALLAVILGYLIVLALGGLIFWGIGSFIVWAFNIDFEWTFWHGIAIQIIFVLLKQIFNKTQVVKKGEDLWK